MRPGQQQAGFFTANFSDPRLVAMAAALAPAVLRVGGGDEDKMVYGADPNYAPKNCSAGYDPWTIRNKTMANLLLVTPGRYAELAGFAEKAQLRLVFAFSIFYGYCCNHNDACAGHCTAGCEGECSPWDSSNAEAMLKHMKETDQVPWGVQLGAQPPADLGAPCRPPPRCR